MNLNQNTILFATLRHMYIRTNQDPCHINKQNSITNLSKTLN